MPEFFAPLARLPDGWARDVRFSVDAKGDIAAVTANAARGEAALLPGPTLPGLADLHSHAFQHAMAGLTERATGGDDDFWSWRETMYGFLAKLAPRDMEAIATRLYVELVKHGFTSVAEFHYVHADPKGEPYETVTEMADRAIAAAAAAGIGMTMLPVVYRAGGFGAAPLSERQKRFALSEDVFADLYERLARRHRGDPNVRVGIAPHSLRAVPPDHLARAVALARKLDKAAPIHIHISEQPKEVAECRAWSGTTPISWLAGNAPLDEHWCLVHATHATADEIATMANARAVVGLCPTTEANLGDGIFPLPEFLAQGGRFGIGTDSNVCQSPVEELRWLEYGLRLTRLKRNVVSRAAGGSTGALLFAHAAEGGAQACGRKVGKLAAGWRADFVVLDPEHPSLLARREDELVDTWLFSGNSNPVRDVVVGGEWVVREFHHRHEDQARADYAKSLGRLRS
ncbi:MAG: formimidoylglutamate deiminase [Tagaea sp.]